MSEREPLTRCRTNTLLADAIHGERSIRWTPDSGDTVLSGTVRSGVWTSSGHQTAVGTDPRDAHIRITMDTGLDRYIAWSTLAALIEQRDAFIKPNVAPF